MKLVIDIPEDMYMDADILIVKDLPELKKIISNGTPLPKGHGDLIDRDVACEELSDISHGDDLLRYVPTVIKADRKGDNGYATNN